MSVSHWPLKVYAEAAWALLPKKSRWGLRSPSSRLRHGFSRRRRPMCRRLRHHGPSCRLFAVTTTGLWAGIANVRTCPARERGNGAPKSKTPAPKDWR